MGKVYRVAQVGTGGMGQGWIRQLKANEQVEIVALIDLNKDAAIKSAEKHELSAELASDSLDTVLAEKKPDFVVDVTVPAAHKPVTIAALKAGCHVLGEKPLADSMESAKEMLAAAKAADKIYMVSQNRRWFPAVRTLRKAVADGLIGKVTSVNADFFIGAHFGGFRAEMKHPLLLDMAIHHFDLMRCMLPVDPQAVYCHAFNPTGSWYQNEVAASAIYECTDNIVFTYRGSWCAEGKQTGWNADWEIIGEKGSLGWCLDEQPTLTLVTESDELIWDHETKDLEIISEGGDGQQGSLQRFIQAIEAGEQPESNCFDNIKSLAMVFSAIESHDKKARIEIDV